MKEVRKYQNNVNIEFEHPCDIFGEGLKSCTHYKQWNMIIRFLRSRGFKIGSNPGYEKNYSILSKYHKLGYKKGVAVLLEITGRGVNLNFGDVKNLWTGHAQNFWNDKSDSRHTKLSYLGYKAVELEIKKVIEFCTSKFDLPFNDRERKMTAEEYIIDNLRGNTHIHGVVNCLEDIKNSITENTSDYHYNSHDRDKNRITCGDRKFFYDYQGILSVGIAWHHINNMWWVICGKEKHNKACFDLFDFDPSAPRRRRKGRTLESIRDKFSAQHNYLRAHKIQKLIEKGAA